MYSLRWHVQCMALVLFLTQPIFSEVIRFNDGEINYEYDNSSKPLGRGAFAIVYKGIRTEKDRTIDVAFKELQGNQTHEELLKEATVGEILGKHDSFPIFYRYFPETNETKAVFVMEIIGKTMFSLWKQFRPFHPIAVLQVGLETLDAIEYMHAGGYTHNDIHYGNIAIGYQNKSKLYVIDFGTAEIGKNQTSWDLFQLKQTFEDLLRSNRMDEVYDRINALNEFESIAREYTTIEIGDDLKRNETFNKLRSVLRAEIESHKNETDFEKHLDIAYIQDDSDGINLLRKLIKQNDTAAIATLLDQGLNVSTGFGNSSYFKPIHLAAELGNASVVQLLIDHGSKINFKYNETHYLVSPIHYAAKEGKVEVVRLLCERGADINAKLCDGYTPLQWAVLSGHADVVRTLCEIGADVNTNEIYGDTPLLSASRMGRFDIVQILADHGADINVKESEEGNTPLHHAVLRENVDAVRFLVKRGANLKAVDNNGKTPLDIATELGNEAIIKILKEAGQPWIVLIIKKLIYFVVSIIKSLW